MKGRSGHTSQNMGKRDLEKLVVSFHCGLLAVCEAMGLQL